MKRKIFTLAFTAAALIASAQTPGYTSTSLYDDFANTEDYSEANPVDPNYPEGAYWWGKANTGVNPDDANDPNNTDACYLANKYAITRAGNNKLAVTVSQDSKCWQPFGVSTKLNLANNATFEVSITNTGSDAIYFDIALIDENKKVINADGSGNNFRFLSIAPNETKVLSGDFAGGKHKTWVNGSATLSSGLDLSKVVEVDFTVVNADQPEGNDWEPVAITNATFTINYLKLGLTTAGNSLSESSVNSISIYPNPAQSEQVTFSQTLTNVKVYNAIGELVVVQAQAEKLDVSTLSQGVYFLTSTQGSSKLIVQ
jgi:hypothetical protein